VEYDQIVLLEHELQVDLIEGGLLEALVEFQQDIQDCMVQHGVPGHAVEGQAGGCGGTHYVW